MEKEKIQTIEAYIAQFPNDIQLKLQELRHAIQKAAPNATEKISYQMPAFYQKGNLVYFAAYKNHIGFYPTASGIETFKDEMAAYKWSKGAVQFPISEPIPLELVEKIVHFRVLENETKFLEKKKQKK